MNIQGTCIHPHPHLTIRNAAAHARVPRYQRFVLRAEPESSDVSAAPALNSDADSGSNGGLIAAGAALAGVALFLATNVSSGPTLPDLVKTAIPLERALSNGRPTVMEFYADWCEVCKMTAADTYNVEQQHVGDVNFVMLNIDNTKWAPELRDFNVKGVPEYVFLDKGGKVKAIAVGKLPANILSADFDALSKGEELPYTNIRKEASGVQDGPRAGAQAQPLSHA